MTLLERKNLIGELIKITGSKNDASAECNIILENILGSKNFYEKEYEITSKQYSQIKEILTLRSNNIPLQQILGKAFFMGEEFFVDKNVLIPRPETELLVENLISIAKNISAPKILDIGAGSGCISIMAAKKLPDAKITAIDISDKALKIAAQNAEKFKIQEKISFVNSDIFSNVSGKFDIIVSNPPYISPNERLKLEKEVLNDPHLALFAPDEKGIYFYKKIINEAPEFLDQNGYLLFELGIDQSNPVKELLLENAFRNIKITKDLNGIDRIISAML